MKSQNLYYITVIITGSIAILCAFLVLNTHNKYPNKITINKALNNYMKLLNTYNNNNNIINSNNNNNSNSSGFFNTKVFPFHIHFTSNNNNNFNFTYNNNDNTLYINNYNSLNVNDKQFIEKILDIYALDKNITKHLNTSKLNIENKIPIYRHVNIFYLLDKNESTSSYREYLMQFEMFSRMRLYNEHLPLTLKHLYYDKSIDIINSNTFYRSVNKLNSKITFEELNDKESLHFMLYNTSQYDNDIKVLYHSDINSIIFAFNFKKHLTHEFLSKAIKIVSLQNIIPLTVFNDSLMMNHSSLINEIFKLVNSKYAQYHKLLLISISNLNKINRIFQLYESILTINEVNTKINAVSKYLNAVANNNINIDYNITQLYLDTLFLLESNELVLFEHFFSFEFKVGQFLPVMLPIIYGLSKAIRGIHANKNKK